MWGISKQLRYGIYGCLVGALCTLFIPGFADFSSIWSVIKSYILNLVIWLSQWFGPSILVRIMDKYWTWQAQPIKRMLALFIVLPVYAMGAFFLLMSVMLILLFGQSPEHSLEVTLRGPFWTVPLISTFIALCIQAVRFYRAWQASQREAEVFRSKMLTYKYEALRNQLNPHFLFNTLANLDTLIETDAKKAQLYVHTLSDILRQVIQIHDQDLVSAKEELDFARQYAFLVTDRSGGSIHFEFFDHDVDEDDYLLPLSIQLLIENADKHNAHSLESPVDVIVRKQQAHIEVRNNKKVTQKSSRPSTGMGLRSLQERYAFITDDPVEIIDEENEFIVRIPIVKRSNL